MADNKQTQSTLGAILRGIANGASLGLDDEALTGAAKLLGTHDYGQDLRDNEALDRQQHPYVTTASELAGSVAPSFIPGVGEGNIARLLLNPAVQGAVSAVGNSNDLNTGNVSGAAGQAALGAAEGSILGRAINAVGNRMVTGSFGEVNPTVNFMRNNNIPTPNQYVPTDGLTGVYRQTVRNATNRTPDGIVANQELLSTVNRNVPSVAVSLRDMESPEQLSILQNLDRDTNGSYNSLGLKAALDNAIDNHGIQMRNARINGDYETMRDHNDEASNLLNSALYDFASKSAPIHQAIEQAATPPVASSGNILKHLPAAIGTGIGVASGHLIGGPVGGIALEVVPRVYNSAANRSGVNAINRAVQDPTVDIVNASAAGRNIGKALSAPATSQAATQAAVHESSDDSDPNAAYRQKLKSLGWDDKSIDSVIN